MIEGIKYEEILQLNLTKCNLQNNMLQDLEGLEKFMNANKSKVQGFNFNANPVYIDLQKKAKEKDSPND